MALHSHANKPNGGLNMLVRQKRNGGYFNQRPPTPVVAEGVEQYVAVRAGGKTPCEILQSARTSLGLHPRAALKIRVRQGMTLISKLS